MWALHHYDRLGLLRARHTPSRHRLFSDSDLERLEQIVALQFLGIPLRQIGRLLDGETKPDFSEALRRQRRALEEKRNLLDRAIQAIREAERHPYPEALKTHHRGDRNAKQRRLDEVVFERRSVGQNRAPP